jgi:3-dehydroquinate dehydratase
MSLTKEDLKQMSDLLDLKLDPIKNDVHQIKKDIHQMKKDIKILATINQLDQIKKDSRLRVLYDIED